MKEHSFFSHGLRGCLINLVSVILAISALAISTNVQHPGHPLCRGGLGAGFPVLFICDAGAGGSPISSWNKITAVDIPNGGIRPGGFLLDFFFYTALIWIAWIIVAGILRKGIKRHDLWWAAFISVGYIAGLLCASLIFFSSDLFIKNYVRTPTPNSIIIPSATQPGTMPSVITPIATTAP